MRATQRELGGGGGLLDGGGVSGPSLTEQAARISRTHTHANTHNDRLTGRQSVGGGSVRAR